MADGVGVFLNFYVFPLVGCTLLALGAWFTWAIWRELPARRRAPSLPVRVGVLALGLAWGWILTDLAYARDAAHVTVGFPMPVLILARDTGSWAELRAVASIPCMVLDLVIGIGLANGVLLLVWKRRALRRKRRRAMRSSLQDL